MFVSSALIVGLFLVVSPGLSFPEKDIPNVEPEYLDMLLQTQQYDLFSKLMKIDDVNLVRPSERERSTNPMFNEGLEFGDYLVLKKQKEEARQIIKFERYGGSKWQTGVVPYEISSDFNSNERNIIQNGINRFNQLLSPCVRFEPRNGQNDYVLFFNGNGCYTYLGRIGGQQPLSLQKNGCLSQGTVLHEMAHVVGITHEQNRIDRDNYIDMKWENIPERWRSQYQKNNERDFRDVRGYDYYSVMHYPVNAPETNKPAFDVRQGNINKNRIGRANDFTTTDINTIRDHYC